MKLRKYLALVLIILFIGLSFNKAQAIPSTLAGYHLQVTSVTSATIPVSVMLPASRTSFNIWLNSGSAVPLSCGPYKVGAACPGSPDVNYVQLDVGPGFSDNDAPTATGAIAAGWCCVLSTGVVPVIVNSIWRP